MLTGITNSKISKIISILLIISIVFFSTAYYPLKAIAQSTSPSTFKIAIAGIVDNTEDELIGRHFGLETISSIMSNYEGVEVISSDVVDETLEDVELSIDNVIEMGEIVKADAVVLAEVDDVKVIDGRQAITEITLSLLDVETHTLLGKAVVMGNSGEKYGYTGKTLPLVEEAVRRGLTEASRTILSNLNKYGIITVVKDKSVLTNFASRDNIKVGTELAVFRNFQQIGTLKVTKVTTAYSECAVIAVNPGYSVQTSDKIRIVYTPPEAITLKEEAIDPLTQRPKKKEKMSPALVGLLAIVVIAALATGGGGKSAIDTGRGETDFYRRRDPVTSSETCPPGQQPCAIVQAPASGFDPAFEPAKPTKLSNVSLGTNPDIQALTNTAYEFSLKSGSATNFPEPYTIKLSYAAENVSSEDINKLKVAYYNSKTGEWETQQTTPNTEEKSVSTSVTHFSIFAIVIDKSIGKTPPATPTGFSVSCGQNRVNVSWICNAASDTATHYRLYACPNQTDTCTTLSSQVEVKQTPPCSLLLTNLTNNKVFCYALTAYDEKTKLESLYKTDTQCTIPGTNCGSSIDLISPPNGARTMETKPKFIFIGNGNADSYILTVSQIDDKIGTTVVWSTTLKGEGSISIPISATGTVSFPGRKNFDVTYAGTSLLNDKIYYWKVTPVSIISGLGTSSQEWSFTEVGGQTEVVGCSANPTPLNSPVLISPDDGANIIPKTPELMWGTVENATSYILTVKNDTGTIVYQKNTTRTLETYTGVNLVDNKTYKWYVKAINNCTSTPDTKIFPRSFTKIPEKGTTQLGTPIWSESPITSGDQYVALSWLKSDEKNLSGYAIYRGKTITEVTGSGIQPIAKIPLSQLDVVPSNISCPRFSTANPGYCDVGVTNGGRYYYAIAAYDAGEQYGQMSVPQSVLLDLQRPSLLGPGGPTATQVTAETPVFSWLPVNGESVSYILTLQDTTTNLIIWQPTITGASGMPNIAYAGATKLVDEIIYRWNVKAVNLLTQSKDSQWFLFKKKPQSTKPDPPVWNDPQQYQQDVTPALVADPQNSAITLTWHRNTAQNNIEWYRIYRSTSPSFPGSDNTTPMTQVRQPSSGSYVSFTDRGLTNGQYYYYKLEALDSNSVTSLKTDAKSIFLYLYGPTLLTPVNKEVVYESKPIFSWVPVPGAKYYNVQVQSGTDKFTNPSEFIWSAQTTNLTARFDDETLVAAKEPLKNNNPSPYYWRVCAVADLDIAEHCTSEPFQFTKKLGTPQMINPPDGQYLSISNPTFLWTAVPGARAYTIRMCKGTQNTTYCGGEAGSSSVDIVWDQFISLPAETEDETIGYTLPGSIQLENCGRGDDPCANTGKYYWHVRALDLYGNVSEKWDNLPTRKFYKMPVAPPILIAPVDGQVLDPDPTCAKTKDLYGNDTYTYKIYFTWGNVTGAGGYTVKIEEVVDPATGKMVTIWQQSGLSSGGVNVNSSCGGTNNIPLSAAHKYKWNVAVDATPFDPNNAKEFITGLPYPKLLLPTNESRYVLYEACDLGTSDLCINLNWESVIGAARYEVEIIKNQQGESMKCKDGQEETSTPKNNFCDFADRVENMTSNTLYTWRVRAIAQPDASNPDATYPGPWSQYWKFTVLIPGPVLSSPPDSSDKCKPESDPANIPKDCTAVGCTDPAFWWTPIPQFSGTINYKIEVSDAAGFGNLMFKRDTASDDSQFQSVTSVSGGKAYNGFLPTIGQIPLLNGIKFYWRVGATANAGVTWIYSNVSEFVKRPPKPVNVNPQNPQATSVEVHWEYPVNCNDASEAESIPPIQPNGGFVVYQETSNPTNNPTNIVGLKDPFTTQHDSSNLDEDTTYWFCVATYDSTGYYTHQGHVSEPNCISYTTACVTQTGCRREGNKR